MKNMLNPKEGFVWVFNKQDGRRSAEINLSSAPVFDGLAVAGGRLFVATQAEKLCCYGKR